MTGLTVHVHAEYTVAFADALVTIPRGSLPSSVPITVRGRHYLPPPSSTARRAWVMWSPSRASAGSATWPSSTRARRASAPWPSRAAARSRPFGAARSPPRLHRHRHRGRRQGPQGGVGGAKVVIVHRAQRQGHPGARRRPRPRPARWSSSRARARRWSRLPCSRRRLAVRGWVAEGPHDTDETVRFSVLTNVQPLVEVFPLDISYRGLPAHDEGW